MIRHQKIRKDACVEALHPAFQPVQEDGVVLRIPEEIPTVNPALFALGLSVGNTTKCHCDHR